MATSSPSQQRSRNGCWTCKRRRRKCDETRPTCNVCRQGGYGCEGYEARLRWDVGVASRGHLTGATNSTPESAPVRTKGRQRDLLKQAKQRDDLTPISYNPVDGTSQEVNSSPDSSSIDLADASQLAWSPSSERSERRKSLFQKFRTSSSRLLYATQVDDNAILPILELSQRSQTLYSVCVACQAYMSHGADQVFYDFYSEALANFRAEIDPHALRTTDEALLHSALLLCTIGMLHGSPWTIHIHGMHELLDERTASSPLDAVEPDFVQAVEVMGVMDLTRFTVGRQTPSLQVWRRYRLGELVKFEEDSDTVQSMAGLPRSLLDLIAMDDDEIEEQQILSWPGCDGTSLQCQLWEAWRFALLIDLRRRKPKATFAAEYDDAGHHVNRTVLSDKLLLTRAISAIDAVINGQLKPDASGSLVMNAMLFPLFHTSLEVLSQEDENDRHNLVTDWFKFLLDKDPFFNTTQAWYLVQDVANMRNSGVYCTPDELATSKSIEIGLF